MPRSEKDRPAPPPRPADASRRGWLVAAAGAGLGLALHAAQAEPAEFADFEIVRGDDGLLLNFALRFELPHSVQDALQKGVALYFVADAQVYSDRWYWTDKHVAGATRTWRVAYQPLTRKYRVTFGGLNQNYDQLSEALAAVRRVSGWRLAEPGQLDPGARHYVEFTFQLDTTQLPRPMQIGLADQPEWTLKLQRFQRFN